MGEGEMGDYKYEPMDDFPWWKTKLASWLGRDSVARVTTAFSDGTGTPIDISAWKGLKGVENVGFDHALVDDLSVLKGLPRLRKFNAFQAGNNPNPGNGLEVLGECKCLEHVSLLSSFQMNDKVLDAMCNAENIRYLKFDMQEVTDLSALKRLRHIEELTIFFNPYQPVPNFQPLESLSNLKRLTFHFHRDQHPKTLSFLANLKQLEYFEFHSPLSEQQVAEILPELPHKCEIVIN